MVLIKPDGVLELMAKLTRLILGKLNREDLTTFFLAEISKLFKKPNLLSIFPSVLSTISSVNERKDSK